MAAWLQASPSAAMAQLCEDRQVVLQAEECVATAVAKAINVVKAEEAEALRTKKAAEEREKYRARKRVESPGCYTQAKRQVRPQRAFASMDAKRRRDEAEPWAEPAVKMLDAASCPTRGAQQRF